MTTKYITVPVSFEIVNSNKNKAIFKRVVSSKGRTTKEVRKIENSLPVTVLHYISDDDYTRLKRIESQLIIEYLERNPNRVTFSDVKKQVLNFLEIY